MSSDAIKRQIDVVKALAADTMAQVACPNCTVGEVRFQDSAPDEGGVFERTLSCDACDYRSFVRMHAGGAHE